MNSNERNIAITEDVPLLHDYCDSILKQYKF